MLKRKCEESSSQPSKLAKNDDDENVVLVLDQFIQSEDLKMKMFCESMIASLLASDEFSDLIEFYGQIIVKDPLILKALRKRMNKNVWGAHLEDFDYDDELLKDKEFVLDHVDKFHMRLLHEDLKNDLDVINAVWKEWTDWLFSNI